MSFLPGRQFQAYWLRELRGLGQRAECVTRAVPSHARHRAGVTSGADMRGSRHKRTRLVKNTVTANEKCCHVQVPNPPTAGPKMKRQTRVPAHFEAVACHCCANKISNGPCCKTLKQNLAPRG